jgi:hypothetical protein
MAEKLLVAREQLVVALDLFIADVAPMAVHSLAGNAWEILERQCRSKGLEPFFEHIQATNPGQTPQELRRIVYRYHRTFKHADPKATKEDEENLREFSDEHNDYMLSIASHDYLTAADKLTVELQVFQMWFYAAHPGALTDTAQQDAVFENWFPDLLNFPRSERKIRLREVITKVSSMEEIIADPRTDSRDDLPVLTARRTLEKL